MKKKYFSLCFDLTEIKVLCKIKLNFKQAVIPPVIITKLNISRFPLNIRCMKMFAEVSLNPRLARIDQIPPN